MFVIILLILTYLSFGIGVNEAIKIAIENNPRIKALEERLKTFEGLKISAGAFPNPSLRFESGFITTDKDFEPEGRILYLLEYEQPLPLWGIREKRKRVIQKEEEAFRNLIDSEKRVLAGEVYIAFYESLFRKEVVRIWEENYRVAKEVLEFVKKSYEYGEATPLELLRARREENIAKIRLQIARAEYEASLRRLSGLIAKEVKDVEGNLRELLNLKSVNPEEVPSVLSLKNRVEAFTRRLEVERALSKPQLGFGFIVEDSEEGYYGLRALISAEIPFFYRRQGEIISALSERNATKKEMEAEILRVRTALNSIKVMFDTILSQIRKLEEEVIPQAEEELELALKSYRERVITLLELSDVRRRYYELLIQRAELYRDLHRVYGEFIKIGGYEP